MARQEKPGSTGFDLGHFDAVLFVAEVVLWNGSGICKSVLKCRLPGGAQQNPQVFANKRNELLSGQRSQFWIALPSRVSGQEDMAGGSAIWKQGGGKDCT